MVYLTKTPEVLKPLGKQFLWNVKTEEKVLFLTFDDGPIPGVTPKVLDLLNQYNAKASFFCVGENVKRHPEIFKQVKNQGHLTANHTYNHLNGWKTPNYVYYKNILKSDDYNPTSYMRPPYGRITRNQADHLMKRYTLVMWDVLSGDFDQKITPKKCARNVLESARPGSIIVFHDSIKAEKNMLFALELTLNYFSRKGYRFLRLDEFNQNS